MEWKQIRPDDPEAGYGPIAPSPGPRDIWGGSFSYGSAFYVFGGAYAEFGPPRARRDLSTIGVLNDLWRFDTADRRWTRLHPNDGSRNYGSSARYPGARVLPSLSVVGDCAYLYGGLTVMEEGFVTRALNDLWRYDIEGEIWEQLHPDTGVVTYDSRPSYPSCRSAASTAVVGESIYVFGGWPGIVPVFLLNDFWRYDTRARRWEQIHTHDGASRYDRAASYPGTRYCASAAAYEGCIYLFSGRDSRHRSPEFFDDLWRYETASDRWTLLHPDDGSEDFGPSAAYPPARYGSACATVGSTMFLFGGSNEQGTERNDFWAYDMAADRWRQVHAHDGSKEYSAGAGYPGVRRVAAMERAGDELLLFGGLDLYAGTAEHGTVRAFNDLWSISVSALESDG